MQGGCDLQPVTDALASRATEKPEPVPRQRSDSWHRTRGPPVLPASVLPAPSASHSPSRLRRPHSPPAPPRRPVSPRLPPPFHTHFRGVPLLGCLPALPLLLPAALSVPSPCASGLLVPASCPCQLSLPSQTPSSLLIWLRPTSWPALSLLWDPRSAWSHLPSGPSAPTPWSVSMPDGKCSAPCKHARPAPLPPACVSLSAPAE